MKPRFLNGQPLKVLSAGPAGWTDGAQIEYANLLDDIRHGTMPRAVVVGAERIGKSTLMHRLLFDLNTPVWPEVAFLIQARKPGGPDKIDDVLAQALARNVGATQSEAKRVIQRLRDMGRLVLLIDGFDPLLKSKPQQRLKDLLGRPANCRVVVAVRDDAMCSFRTLSGQANWTVVELLGFDDNAQSEHLGTKRMEAARNLLSPRTRSAPGVLSLLANTPANQLSALDTKLLDAMASPRHAVAQILGRSAEDLLRECDPYIFPPLGKLGRAGPRNVGKVPRGPSEDEPLIPLPEEVLAGVLKDSRPIRVVIEAESGLGKSMLLAYIQRKIVALDDGRLPLRFERLTEYDWRNLEEVRTSIADGLRHSFPCQADTPLNAPKPLVDRLERMINDGKIVFLFDAIEPARDCDGFETFLDRVGRCAVVATVQPHEAPWAERLLAASDSACQRWRLSEFDRIRQREFLGEAANSLAANTSEALERVLGVPLLLRMVRDLVANGRAHELYNEFQILRLATEAFVHPAGTRSLTIGTDGVHDTLTTIAGVMALAWNLGGDVRGERYQELCQKLGLTSIEFESLFRTGLLKRLSDGFQWRHPRYMEFYAARHLASDQQSDARIDAVVQHGRDRGWWPTFRLLLSKLEARSPAMAVDFAKDILRRGGAFLVEEWIWRDRRERGLDQLALLARWLVHRDREYFKAWQPHFPRPEPTAEVLEILESLLRPEHRDSRFVYAALELLYLFGGELEERARSVRRSFHDERQRLRKGELSHPTLARVSPRDPQEILNHLERDFAVVGGTSIELATHPVTNEEFNLFDRFHVERWPEFQRAQPDAARHPTVNISWYQACAFAFWCGAEMPNADDWERGVQGDPNAQKQRYCLANLDSHSACCAIDDGTLKKVAWYRENADGRTHAVMKLPPNAIGIHDGLGNVREWCRVPMKQPGLETSLAGGCFDDSAEWLRVGQRQCTAHAMHSDAFTGFRLARPRSGNC